MFVWCVQFRRQAPALAVNKSIYVADVKRSIDIFPNMEMSEHELKLKHGASNRERVYADTTSGKAPEIWSTDGKSINFDRHA